VRRVALFARPPRVGQVKTRLSPALPAEQACALYRALLADALTAIAEVAADERLVYWADEPHDGEPLPHGIRARTQRGDDLGARLGAAFDELLQGDEARAVAIGADAPELDAGRIAQAFAALEENDLALVPALDGGFALIALGRRAPSLFAGVAWSTSAVIDQVLERARAADLRVARLAPIADLDTPADLVALVARALERPAIIGAATRDALARLALLPPV